MGSMTLAGRMATMSTAVLMAGMGLTGAPSAQTITNTGPHSTNIIKTSTTNECTVENNTDIHVTNTNDQNATSGDATVGDSGRGWFGPLNVQADTNGNNSGSTLADNASSSLDSLAPQASDPDSGGLSGTTPSLFNSDSNWPKDLNGGNATSGDAASGNATNSNSTNLSVTVGNTPDTGNPCVPNNTHIAKQLPPTKVLKTGVRVAPGAPAVSTGHGTRTGGFSAVVVPAVATQASPTVSAATAVTPGRGAGQTAAVSQERISATGPGSSNVISSNVDNQTTVTNNNTICITATNTQQASTGDATTSSNTSSSSSNTGGAGNGNSTGVGADLAS